MLTAKSMRSASSRLLKKAMVTADDYVGLAVEEY